MSDQPIVLVPGLMCDERIWAPQVDALGPMVQVADVTGQNSIRGMATALLEQAPGRFALAGLSMGGIVAFEVWRQAPDRVTHLALLDTTPREDAEKRRATLLDQIHESVLGGRWDAAATLMVSVYLAPANRDQEAIINTLIEMSRDSGPDVFRRQSNALADRPDSIPTLPTIDCPVTIICGEADRICPVSEHELMAGQISDSKLIVIPDCGHVSTLERPDVVNRALQSLFSG